MCIYIAYQGKNILLDTGSSELFLENAGKLSRDLKDIDYAVLSHAHYDHANGMKAFFETNEKATFYLQKGTEENCYMKKWFFRQYIGIPKGILEEYKERIQFAEGDFELCPGVTILPHKTEGLSKIGKRNNMYIRSRNGWKPDDFSHEQSLVFATEEGLVIFNSCSHGGADNIINEVKATFPDKKVKAIIGGFHLYGKPKKEVRELAKRIKNTGIQEVYTGHCTGKKAYRVLKEELGDMVHQLNVGLEIEL